MFPFPLVLKLWTVHSHNKLSFLKKKKVQFPHSLHVHVKVFEVL